MYCIDVHIYFPPTMFTPSYEEENKVKPAITLKIEETDIGITPEKAAAGLIRGRPLEYEFSFTFDSNVPAGIRRDNFHITTDIMTDLFRVSGRAAAPCNKSLVDFLKNLIAWVSRSCLLELMSIYCVIVCDTGVAAGSGSLYPCSFCRA